MSGHWGIPGPGGSMGRCAVCGDSFIGGVIKDLMGIDSGIESFKVGFVDQMLYCHEPKCKDRLKEAFDSAAEIADEAEKNCMVRDAMPDGPLKKVLTEAIEKQTELNDG